MGKKTGTNKGKKLFGIRKRILLITLSLVISAIFLMAIGAIYEFGVSTKDNFENNALSVSSSVKRLVEDKLGNVEHSIDYTIDNLNLGNDEQSINESKELVKALEERNSDIQLAYFYNDTSKTLQIYPEVDTGSDDVEGKEWYIKAKKSKGEFIITDTYKDSITSNYVVTVAKAIIENGEFKGVICVDYSLKDFAADIASIKFGDTGVIGITDTKGVMIAHSLEDLIGNDALIKDKCWNDISTNESGLTSICVNDEKLEMAYNTLPETGWKIVMQMSDKEYYESRHKFQYSIILVTVILMAVSLVCVNTFASKLGKRIEVLNKGISKSSEGDFTEVITVDSNDELSVMADNFNNMQSSISNLISVTKNLVENVDESANGLSDMSEQVSKAMNDVAATITEISKGSMQSAQSLETLLGGLDKVSDQITLINKVSGSIGNLAEETNSLSKKGLDVINVVMDKSTQTKESALDVKNVVKEVEDSVKNIAVMNETISEITEQTNLLALNAAIEAARAGDAGKGFAVVAEEIRTLAEQTALSAKNIEEVISKVVETVSVAVRQVEETSSIVETQEEAVINAKDIFGSITDQVNELTINLEDIIKNVEEVNKNKNKVVNEAENISSIVEETAAGTEEVTATAEEVTASTEDVVSHVNKLKDLCKNLEKEIGKFKLQ